MRPLRFVRQPLFVSLGAVLTLALLFSGCDTTEPTEELGDTSAPEETAPVESPEATDDLNTSGVDTETLTTGRWLAAERGDPYLEFSPESGVSGTDGCNNITSTWTVEGDVVRIAPFTSTQKACAGVDAWLNKVSTVALDGESMSVLDAAGNIIGTLTKVGK